MVLRRIHHVMLFNNVFGEDFLAYEYINLVKCEYFLKKQKLLFFLKYIYEECSGSVHLYRIFLFIDLNVLGWDE